MMMLTSRGLPVIGQMEEADMLNSYNLPPMATRQVRKLKTGNRQGQSCSHWCRQGGRRQPPPCRAIPLQATTTNPTTCCHDGLIRRLNAQQQQPTITSSTGSCYEESRPGGQPKMKKNKVWQGRRCNSNADKEDDDRTTTKPQPAFFKRRNEVRGHVPTRQRSKESAKGPRLAQGPGTDSAEDR